MPPTTSAPTAAVSPPVQRAAPPRQARRFAALVLADAATPVASHIHRTLIAAGASEVRFAGSAADLLRSLAAPSGSGVCVICGSPYSDSIRQLVAALRSSGWRRVVINCPDADEQSVRLAIASKVRCLVRSLAPEVPGQRRAPGGADLDLSTRELEVLQAVADGCTNNEVGEALGLSGLTVKSHLARIGRKAGTGDRAQMVALAMRAGLIS